MGLKKEKISNRCTAYIFHDLGIDTFVYLVETKKKVFIVDTFCGSLSMEPILVDLEKMIGKKAIIVNTHFHWDHVWGNCAFSEEIISHGKCRAYLDRYWEKQIEAHKKQIRGRTEKKLPTITFSDRFCYPEEGIELFYSPGHTDDSISLFDHDDKLLYAGDNLEKPLIYVEDNDLETYIKTLEKYIAFSPKMIMAGHSMGLTGEDLLGAIDYLRRLGAGEEMVFTTEYERSVHENNKRVLSKES
mgnify:FL=1